MIVLTLYIQRNLRLDATDAQTWANYLDLCLMRMVDFTNDSMTNLMTDFPMVNFPYSGSNIPESPIYGVFVSQLMRYTWVCSKYEYFLFNDSVLVSVIYSGLCFAEISYYI